MPYVEIPVSPDMTSKISEDVLEIVSTGVVLAGGAARSMYDSSPIHDYDLYFTTPAYITGVAKYLGDKNYKCAYASPDHKFFTYIHNTNRDKIQLIGFRDYYNPKHIIDTFDFTITQFAYSGNSIITTQKSLDDLKNKMLCLHKLTYPTATMKRVSKYVKYGFTHHPMLFIDIVLKIMHRDINIINSRSIY